MSRGSTYTYAILEVSDQAYEEIAQKLKDAGYSHAFDTRGEITVIDMHGIALGKKGVYDAQS